MGAKHAGRSNAQHSLGRMSMKSIPSFVWIVPAILLAIAVSRLPYGYYTFLRIVTCGAASVIAVSGFQKGPATQVWSVLLILIAVLFNPFVPIHLHRATWFYLDLGTAAVFLGHLFFVRRRLEYGLLGNGK
jgi:hypothetical protein